MEPQHQFVLSRIMELQQQENFSDLIIELKGKERVSACRTVVATLSPVFQRMLETDMKEKRSGVVQLPDMSPEIWTCILDFHFSEVKSITAENVGEVISYCDLYQLDLLKNYCCGFLAQCCDVENCLEVRALGRVYDLASVVHKATTVITENFWVICRRRDFLSIGREEILEFVTNPDIVTTEDDLCLGMLAWMENSQADSDISLQLFQLLRLPELSTDCLVNHVMYNSFVKASETAMEMVRGEITKRCLSVCTQDISEEPRRRGLLNTNEDLIVLGGVIETGQRMRKVALYWSAQKDEWLELPAPSQDVNKGFAAALLGTSVVLAGGNQSDLTFFLDTQTLKWSKGPKLLQARGYHGMTVIEDKVFAVAGSNYTSTLWDKFRSIEEYSRESGVWSFTGNLVTPTDECGVASLGSRIIVVGGGDQESQKKMQTYDIKTDSACVLDTRIPRPMYHGRGCTFGNYAVFVGSNGDMVLISMKRHLNLVGFAQLNYFRDRKWFGLSFDGRVVRTIGGGDYGIGFEVMAWNLQGERERRKDVQELPLDLNVCALLQCRIPTPMLEASLRGGQGGPNKESSLSLWEMDE